MFDSIPEPLVLLVLPPQPPLSGRHPADDGGAVIAPNRFLCELDQRLGCCVPEEAVLGEALCGLGGFRDDLGLGHELGYQLLQGGVVPGLDAPTGTVFLEGGGKHLPWGGDDRQSAAEVVNLPKAQVQVSFRVGHHEIEGN